MPTSWTTSFSSIHLTFLSALPQGFYVRFEVYQRFRRSAENLPFSANTSGLPFSLNILPVFETFPSQRQIFFCLTGLFITILCRFSVVSRPFLPFWHFESGVTHCTVISKCRKWHLRGNIFRGSMSSDPPRGSRLRRSWTRQPSQGWNLVYAKPKQPDIQLQPVKKTIDSLQWVLFCCI